MENQKYYLLMFKHDYDQEFVISSIACFKESEFLTWQDANVSYENFFYDEEQATYEEWMAKREAFSIEATKRKKEINTLVGTLEHLNKISSDYYKWEQANRVKNYIAKPKRGNSKLHTIGFIPSDGNDYSFAAEFNDYLKCHELIKAGVVTVQEVSVQFYNDFHAAGMDKNNLTNVFELHVLN